MRNVTGDLWSYPADVRVITTNGTVKRNGDCVMGRGCALEAKDLFPGLARDLGALIRRDGNVAQLLRTADEVAAAGHGRWALWSFPVKHLWMELADLTLIAQSAVRLSQGTTPSQTVVLPRPGCGNGGLRWEHVAPVLAPLLDDRFHVITFEAAAAVGGSSS